MPLDPNFVYALSLTGHARFDRADRMAALPAPVGPDQLEGAWRQLLVEFGEARSDAGHNTIRDHGAEFYLHLDTGDALFVLPVYRQDSHRWPYFAKTVIRLDRSALDRASAAARRAVVVDRLEQITAAAEQAREHRYAAAREFDRRVAAQPHAQRPPVIVRRRAPLGRRLLTGAGWTLLVIGGFYLAMAALVGVFAAGGFEFDQPPDSGQLAQEAVAAAIATAAGLALRHLGRRAPRTA